MSGEFIFVVGPFSSGTTAVTGMIMRLGAIHMEPLSLTNDPRTPSSLESVAFQRLCNLIVDETTLKTRLDRNFIMTILEDFKYSVLTKFADFPDLASRPVVFKRATTAFMLDEIRQIFNPKFVFVSRSLEDIEKTKIRRGWAECHGKWGAEIIQEKMSDWYAKESGKNIFNVNFEDVRENPHAISIMLNEALNLSASDEMISSAAEWVESHQRQHANTEELSHS